MIRPRGYRVKLPHGGLPEVFPPYLVELIEKTGGLDGPIGKQFVAQPDKEQAYQKKGMSDPLMEDIHEVAPGLVYKYRSKTVNGKIIQYGRALWTITRHCAAYCRFCTRGREVGIAGYDKGLSNAALSNTPYLSIDQIHQGLSFIEKEKGLNEVILSGGDPLMVNSHILSYILRHLGALQEKGKLSIIRIGTRVPVHNPRIITDVHISAIQYIKNPRIMAHINHPFELTDETLAVFERLRKETNAIIMSQTVLLKGINDTVEILYDLFQKLAAEGIVPYYLIQNDAVYWAKHFTVPIQEAIAMWQQLRPMLSGVAATARFVIDVAKGNGKVVVPEGGSWEVDYDKGFRDFNGEHFSLSYDQIDD